MGRALRLLGGVRPHGGTLHSHGRKSDYTGVLGWFGEFLIMPFRKRSLS